MVPGSHKANLNPPPGLVEWDDWQHLVQEIHGKAGDAIIFSETCESHSHRSFPLVRTFGCRLRDGCCLAGTHGTLPWTAKHQRRAILYKYSPSHMAYSGGGINTDDMPAWHAELSAEQHATLISAGTSGRAATKEAIAQLKKEASAKL